MSEKLNLRAHKTIALVAGAALLTTVLCRRRRNYIVKHSACTQGEDNSHRLVLSARELCQRAGGLQGSDRWLRKAVSAGQGGPSERVLPDLLRPIAQCRFGVQGPTGDRSIRYRAEGACQGLWRRH